MGKKLREVREIEQLRKELRRALRKNPEYFCGRPVDEPPLLVVFLLFAATIVLLRILVFS